HEGVDFFLGGVQGQGGPSGGRHAETVHERLGAVVAGPQGDSFLIQDRADVVRVDAVEYEGNRSGFLPGRTDEAYAGDLQQSFRRIHQELVLVSGDVLQADLLHVVQGGAETDDAGDVGCAGFKLVRQDVVRRLLERH